ncbi:TAXI family TRAP transporter solute-binding subunit [Mesobacillus harenae]|uniref:TAXI family TRAP transporter solute-binding subunit n=1 Tax=Mesobacillus harenae TaxID=2213203 RepID=UPI00158020C3|nr:TAXI family TRAP transporter solute-binding subunit [Mesobacillus harenae]
MKKTFVLKSKLVITLVAAFLLLIAGCSSESNGSNNTDDGSSGEKSGAVTKVSLATGGTGGAWYPIGGGFSNVVNDNSDVINMSAEVTNGGVENVRLVSNNDSHFGFVNTDAAYHAFQGNEPFGKKENIVSMFNLYDSTFQAVVAADSGINSISDLKGKKVVVGPPASSSAQMGWDILEQAGLSEGDIEPLLVSFEEGASALSDGNADALFVMSAAPNSQILNLGATKEIKLLSLEEELRNKIVEKYSYYGKTTLKAGTYDHQADDVETLSLPTMIIANADVSEDVAYEFTKMIYDNLAKVHEFHAMAKDISLENAINVPIPMHPGAKKYFQEQGLDIK